MKELKGDSNWLWSVLVFLLTILSAYGQQATAQGTAQPAANPVSRYITAIQKRDFKTIIDLTYSYQAEIAQIKAQNPQVLWPKLIAAYYDQNISAFSKEPDYWGGYAEALGAGLGDPAQGLRATAALLPPSSKWKITESRNTDVEDLFSAPYKATITYVEVEYPLQTNSPIVEKQRLRKAIVQFESDPKSQLVRSVGRLAAGDEFWPIAALSRETAIELANSSLPQEQVQPFVSVPMKGDSTTGKYELPLSPYDNQWEHARNYLALLRQYGFQVEREISEVEFRDRWLGRSVPPDTIQFPENWNKYRLEYRKSFLDELNSGFSRELHFRLNESTVFQIVSLEQKGITVTAQLHIVNNGCSPICEMVGELYTRILDNYDWTPLRIMWAVNTGSHDDIHAGQTTPEWPMERDGVLNYEWDARAMNWHALYFTTTHLGPLIPAPKPKSGLIATPQPTSPAQPPSKEPSPTPPVAPLKSACGDYNACFRAGTSALQSWDWQRAITDFEAASNQRPHEADPWGGLGIAYMAVGQSEKAPPMWDKALNLGPFGFFVCHERTFQSCERGNLTLDSKQISFAATPGGQVLFSVSPSQVTPTGASTNPLASKASFGLKVGGKSYNFDFIPFGVACQVGTFVQCPDEGISQQMAVGNYISQAIPRLASGALGSPVK